MTARLAGDVLAVCRQFDTRQHVEAQFDKAAAGGDTVQVPVALQIALPR